MLKDKVAVITGATRGIGYATAKKFLENGCKVVIFGSKSETVKKALESLRKENKDYDVKGFYPDLTNLKEVEEVFNKIKNLYGKIDILVNNAGISARESIYEYKEEDFKKIMDLNVNAVFNCSKAVSLIMKENKGGVILNTSSMVSIYGQPSGCGYSASKFAVNGLTKSLARELGKNGIRVNAVAPGIIFTDMMKSVPNNVIEPLIKTIPLGRIGMAEDVANAFLFLASDMASYITGAILPVDGAARS